MKKFLSLVLALVMTMSLVTVGAGAKDFTDNSKIDYDVAVQVMSDVKVIDGYADGSFNPSATLTRGAAAKIICNLILGPTTAGALKADAAPYKDVPADSTFAGYIAYCAQQGIISGYADGTFKPGNSLTGYAFMKMLLGALGYDSNIEGYVGANWSIQVAKRALQVGLDDGLSADFDGAKPVTREEACLYAFNTLQADLVEYDGKTTINVGGTEVTVGASSAKAVTTTNLNDGTGIKNEGSPYTIQFAEKYFPNLTRNPGQFDEMGRPSVEWKVKSKLVAVENLEADVVYSTGVDQKVVAKDLGLTDDINFYYHVDGVHTAADVDTIDTTSTSDIGISDDGIITEVYTADSTGLTKNWVVFINPRLAQVTDVDKDDDGRYVTEDFSANKFHTEEFEENDWVEVYFGSSDNTNSNIDDVTSEMKVIEKQTGKLTKITDNKWTIDGTKYTQSASTGVIFGSCSVGDVVDFWVDSNGYLLGAKVSSASVNVTDLAFVLDAGNSRGPWAKLLFSDGSKKTVDTDVDYTSAYATGAVVKFELDGSTYELESDDVNFYYGTSNSYYFTKGTTEIKLNTTKQVNVDSKTVFVYVDTTAGNKQATTTYVGYKNAPSFNTAGQGAKVAYYVKPGETAAALVYVFIDDAYVTGSSSDVIFFLTREKFGADEGYDVSSELDKGSYYTVKAIVNGEVKELDVKQGSAADIDGVTYYGTYSVYGVKTVKTNSNGQITSVTEADRFHSIANATSKAVTNDVVTLGGTAYAYNDDTNVYFVSKDKKTVTVGTVAGIREDNNGTKDPYAYIAFTTDKDGVLTNVVLVKTK